MPDFHNCRHLMDLKDRAPMLSSRISRRLQRRHHRQLLSSRSSIRRLRCERQHLVTHQPSSIFGGCTLNGFIVAIRQISLLSAESQYEQRSHEDGHRTHQPNNEQVSDAETPGHLEREVEREATDDVERRVGVPFRVTGLAAGCRPACTSQR
jgi:hypothetical protein